MKYKVEVVDMSGNPITTTHRYIPSMYANVLVNFYYYDNQSQGVGCSLDLCRRFVTVIAYGAPISWHRYSSLKEVLPMCTAV